MNDKKHIDRLFQEKFKNFEATPDDAVWENIHNALHKDKRKRRVVPLWWFAAGVAAVLVLLLTVGDIFNRGERFNTPETQTVGNENTRGSSKSTHEITVDQNKSNSGDIENNTSNDLVNTEQSESTENTSKNDIHKKSENDNDKTATQIAQENSRGNKVNPSDARDNITSSKKEKTSVSNIKKEAIAKNTPNLPGLDANQKATEPDGVRNKVIPESEKDQTQIAKVTDQNISKETETLKENKDLIALNKEQESIEEAIAKANSTNEKEKEEQPNRWNITPNVAPVYFNSLGKGSTISSQFVNNSKSGEVNMSYGINGSYAINDKIKIRAGVNKVALGYSTDGVMAFKDINSSNGNTGSKDLQNINFTSQRKADAYMSTSNINSESAPQFMVSNVNGALEQQFEYIEVPLEVEYSIIDSKIGMNVIGGFSTLFLNNNEVYTVLNNERSLLGEANNINSTSYSANFGLGFNYNISHTLKLNLEPMFKYQLNTFTNTSGDFRPYFIGVYTGFRFKF
ncbi:hypothetical protein [Gelidibacter gilvus]|uniref:Outer membrane protein beta-barrel domain-containing protein n=1 Tax=Gelidibacter gilvus TaxID=59602 RepID=A0A4Q0XJG0_9FLAO|nr:hypothetical protein [Gelidibacter gilvus]RXJ52292.1 hypothetical protein ESZ48_00910 [Gelidibacter gilvus]